MENNKPTISIDDFIKLEIKIGCILGVEKIVDSDKLLKLSVDFGEDKPRQIVSGISKYYKDPQSLVGKRYAFATNLPFRIILGIESQGMILAVSGDNFFSLLETSQDVKAGSSVK